MGRVDLDYGDVGSPVFEFGEAVDVVFDLGEGRFLAFEHGEEALDDDGAFAADGEDIGEDPVEGDGGEVDTVHVGLGAGVEFDPDFVQSGEHGESEADLRQVEACPIGEEDDFEEGEIGAGADMDDGADDFGEVGAEGGFALPAEGDRPESEEFLGEGLVLREGAEVVADDEGEGVGEFLGQEVDVHVGATAWGGAVDLAIDAVKVALFIGNEVDADAETVVALGDEGIDEAVIAEFASDVDGGGTGVLGGAVPGPGGVTSGVAWCWQTRHCQGCFLHCTLTLGGGDGDVLHHPC